MTQEPETLSSSVWGERPTRGGYFTYLSASFGQMLLMMLRQNRLILVSVITFLPVIIPLMVAFLTTAAFADDGRLIFVRMMEDAHINTLAPLLALFFASMLVGEDVEMQTLPYVLTRPQPRSAWMLGRFAAYLLVAGLTLSASIVLCFLACTALSGIRADSTDDLLLMAQYVGVGVVALLSYGALSALLGAYTKRPIVYGVLLLYGWQKFAMLIPGLIDFLTIQKYTDAMLPKLATASNRRDVITALGTYSNEVFEVGAQSALLTTCAITVVMLTICIYAVRHKEFAATRAAGT